MSTDREPEVILEDLKANREQRDKLVVELREAEMNLEKRLTAVRRLRRIETGEVHEKMVDPNKFNDGAVRLTDSTH